MKLKLHKQKILQLSVCLAIIGVAFSISRNTEVVDAFVEPSATPPNGNVGAPITTLSPSQTKEGALTVNTDGTSPEGLVVDKGEFEVRDGESSFSNGSYSDPDNGSSYDAKFGGSNNGIAVRGQSYFLGPVGIVESSPDGSLDLDVNGDVGAQRYCDADGGNCYTILDLLNGGAGSIDSLSDGVSDEVSTVFLGTNSGAVNTGSNNTGVGIGALALNTSGERNTAIGRSALSVVDTANGSVAIGYNALRDNTTSNNLAVGTYASQSNTSGAFNTAVGYASQADNQSGNNNTSLGYATLYENVSGTENVAIGSNAVRENVTGNRNTGIGVNALRLLTQGSNNVALGHAAGYSISDGSTNTLLGVFAGDNITTGDRNISIGYRSEPAVAAGNNQLTIGNLIYGTGLNGTNTSISTGLIGIGTKAPQQKLDIESAGDTGMRVGTSATSGEDAFVEIEGARTTSTTDDVSSIRLNNRNGGADFEGARIAIRNSDATSSTANTDLIFSTNNNAGPQQAMLIDDQGRVGVGAAEPLANLQVEDTGNVDLFVNSQGSTSNVSVGIGTGPTSAPIDRGTFLRYSGTTGDFVIDNGGAPSSEFGITTRPATGSSVERFRITEDGDVGIGDTTPDSLLDVESGGSPRITVEKTDTTSGNASLQLRHLRGSGAVSAHTIQSTGTDGLDLEIIPDERFYVSPNGSRQFTVNNAGDVGIGDLSPDAALKLDVEGQVGATEYCDESGTNCIAAGDLGGATQIDDLDDGKSDATTTTNAGSVFLGHLSGSADDGSNYNVGVGRAALNSNTSGHYNTAVGRSALIYNTTGNYNNAFGGNTLHNNTTGSGNTAIGINTLRSNVTGNHNQGIGYNTLYSNTTGAGNVGIGYNTLNQNTTGNHNIAQGMYSLDANTIGGGNVGVGYFTLSANTSGTYNAALGYRALSSNTTASYNVGLGRDALLNTTTGSGNLGVGYYAGYGVTTGGYNTLLGYAAGSDVTTGSRNTAIGYDAEVPSATASDQLSIKNIIYGTGLDGIGSAISSGNIGIGTKTPGAKLHVNNGNNTYGTILASADEASFNLYAKTLSTPAYGEAFRLGLKYGTNEDNGFISYYRGGSGSGGFLGFATNGAERLSIDASGDVGIGDTTPDGTLKLDVEGQVGATEYCKEDGTDCFTADDVSSFTSNSYADGSIVFSENNTLVEDNANFFYDNANDRLGIGTNNPLYPLHVDRTITNNTVGAFFDFSGDVTEGNGLLVRGGGANGGRYILGLQDSAGNDRVRVNASGDVGIGDTTPDATLKLDVEGQVGATEYCDENGANCTPAGSIGSDNLGDHTATQDLLMASNDITGVKSAIFDNQERASMTNTGGEIYFDENFYPDYGEFATNGGGLSVRGEDGWGAVYTTANDQFAKPNFDSVYLATEVGIGDTTPDGTLKLDVEGQVGATEYCDENGANCTAAGGLGGSTTFTGLTDTPSTLTARRIPYTNLGGTALTDDANFVYTGTSLGVGTDTPSGHLEVEGLHAANLVLDAVDSGGAPSATATILLDGYEGRAKGTFITDEDSIDEWFIGEGYNYRGIGIGYDTNTGSQSEYAANAKLFVNTNGNVGVGTSSPNSLLSIRSEVGVNSDLFEAKNDDGSGGATITSDGSGSGVLSLERTGGADGIVLNPGAGGVSYFDNTAGPLAIGDSVVSGTLKLDVEGQVGATEYCDENGANCTAAGGLGGSTTFTGLTDTPSTLSANRIPHANASGTALVDTASFAFDGSVFGVPGDIHAGRGQIVSSVSPEFNMRANRYNYLKLSVIENTANAEYPILRSAGLSTQLYTNNAERVRIAQDGNVGIGDTNPARRLSVLGGTSGSNPAYLSIQSGEGASTNIGDVYAGIELGVAGGENSAGAQEATASITAVDTRNGATTFEDGGLAFNTLDTGSSGVQTRMTVTGSGDVGIGDTTPDATLKLDVEGQVGATEYCDENGANCTAAGGLGGSTTFTGLTDTPASYTAGSLYFAGASGVLEDNANIFWDDTNDRLGIGTTTPNYALDIQKLGDPRLRIFGSDGNDTAGIILAEANDLTQFGAGLLYDGDVNKFHIQSYNAASVPRNDLTVIRSTGNIGIGDESPSERLEVAGNLNIVGDNQAIYFDGKTKLIGDHSIDGLQIRTQDGDPIHFKTNGNNRRMTITGDGDVGIGDTTPNATLKLDVEGQVGATEYCDENGANCTSITGLGGANEIDELIDAKSDAVTSTSGSVFLGHNAGNVDDGSNSNVGVGRSALIANTSGRYNNSIGLNSLLSNTIGNSNQAMGTQALRDNISGSANAAIGLNALRSNTTGNYNVALGPSSLFSNLSGSYNHGIGYQSLYSNTDGVFNQGFGYNALLANTTGDLNSAIGHSALAANAEGSQNNALGYSALASNTSGDYNIAIGTNALRSNVSADYSVAIGTNALRSSVSANFGVAIGGNALFDATGIGNVGVGVGAGRFVSTGEYNTNIGLNSGYNTTAGSRNTTIGYSADVASPTGDDQLSIKNIIYGTGLTGIGSTISPGSIGIGDKSPDGTLKLDVEGQIGATEYCDENGLNCAPAGGGTTTFSALTDTPGTYTAGSLYFAGASTVTEDNANLFWDAANDRLGVGTNTPTEALTVEGGSAARAIVGSGQNTADSTAGLEFRQRYGTAGFPDGQIGASIVKDRNGSSGSADLVFSVADGTVDATEVMRLESNGDVNMATGGGQLIGGMGAESTGGVTNWNDASNARSGNGETLLLGTHANGPSDAGGAYFHPFSLEYNSKDGSGNLTQFAVPYAFAGDQGMYMRSRYQGTWGNWAKFITEDQSGNVGIGTVSPTSTLSVSDGAGINMDFESNANVAVLNPGSTASASVIEGALNRHLIFDLKNNDSNDAIAFRHSSSNNGAVDTIGFVYKGDGAVGIGDTTPDGTLKLDVEGNIGAAQYCDENGANCKVIGDFSQVQVLDDLGDAKSDGVSVFLGTNAGALDNGTANQNVGVGQNSLDAVVSGFYNTAVGFDTLTTATAHNNTAVGRRALRFTSTGIGNSALGRDALEINTTGSYNTAVGMLALEANTEGGENVSVGRYALRRNTTGTRNVAIGSLSVDQNITGYHNVGVGYHALGNSAGIANTALGHGAGDSTTAGGNNIMIGYAVDVPDLTGSHQMTIGNLIYGTGIDGTGQVLSTGNVGIGLQTPVTKLDIAGTNSSDALRLRSGDSSAGFDANQILLSYNGTPNYSHAIKSRHNSSAIPDNAIDFFVWDQGTDAAGAIGTRQVVTMDARNNGSVGIGTTDPVAPLDVDGGVAFAIREISGPTTVTVEDNMILCDASTGTININLLSADDIEGFEVTIKKINATGGDCIMDPAADPIDGQISFAITEQYDSYTVMSDGDVWWIK